MQRFSKYTLPLLAVLVSTVGISHFDQEITRMMNGN